MSHGQQTLFSMILMVLGMRKLYLDERNRYISETQGEGKRKSNPRIDASLRKEMNKRY